MKAWPGKRLTVVGMGGGQEEMVQGEQRLKRWLTGLVWEGEREQRGFLLWRQTLELGKLRPGQSGMWGMQGPLTLPLGLGGCGPLAIERDHRYP